MPRFATTFPTGDTKLLLEDAKGPYVFTVSEGPAKRQDIKVLVETDDMAFIDRLDPALGSPGGGVQGPRVRTRLNACASP